jgi:hypothetical protein
MFGECLTSAIKNVNSFATGFFVKGILMRNPGAAGILEPEDLRIPCNTLDIVATPLIREMAADCLQISPIQLSSEFLRGKAVSAVRLNIPDAKVTHLVKSSGYIFRELLAETVKLQTNSVFEILALLSFLDGRRWPTG